MAWSITPATAPSPPITAGLSTTGNGDRGQSYSYAAASSGDWVYIGTMYGGLGVQAILTAI